MALSVSTLVDEVVDTWHFYVHQLEPTTALSSSINASALTFTVGDPTSISKGLAQIEDEMVYVSSVDRSTSTVTLEPWGRGQQGSTAASHSTDARITMAPSVPRVRAKDLLSQVLQEIFPRLFAVAETTIDVDGATINYALPGVAYHVMKVEWQPQDASESWIPVRRWRQNKTPSGVELEILSPVQIGADTVRVHYIKNPPTALTMSDDLETLGYPLSVRDVVVIGVLHRLAMYGEASRVQISAVESHARGEAVPAGSSTSLSRYLYQVFMSRLEAEALNLQMRYPIVSHFTR